MAARPKDPKHFGRRTKGLDKTVRKIEEAEAKQAAKGKTGRPVRSIGRRIRDGFKENA